MARKLHDLWLETFLLLDLETNDEDRLEWDLDLIVLLGEYIEHLETEIEASRPTFEIFHASTSTLTDEEWVQNFRIHRADHERLCLALGIPEMMASAKSSLERLRWLVRTTPSPCLPCKVIRFGIFLWSPRTPSWCYCYDHGPIHL